MALAILMTENNQNLNCKCKCSAIVKDLFLLLRSIKSNKNNRIRNNSRRNRGEKREIDCVETESGENHRLVSQLKAKVSQKTSRVSPKLIVFIAPDSTDG